MNVLFDKDAEGSVQDTVRMCQWELQIGEVVLNLPEGMKVMSEERQKEFYPYEGKPEMILEDSECNVQISFQLFEKKMKPEETYEAICEVHKLIGNAFPKYKRTRVYLADDGPIKIGWFLIQMEDQKKEHVKAVFSALGKMALLTITYMEAEKWKWRVLLRSILASMRLGMAYKGDMI